MSEAQQEKPADAWGQPISEERQAELQAISTRGRQRQTTASARVRFDGTLTMSHSAPMCLAGGAVGAR